MAILIDSTSYAPRAWRSVTIGTPGSDLKWGGLEANGRVVFDTAHVKGFFIENQTRFLGAENDGHGFSAEGLIVDVPFAWQNVQLDNGAILDLVGAKVAQLQSSGSSFTPTPSVIKNLPTKLVIPAGQTSAIFNALAQRVGSPYNVQFYAFQTQGQQAGYPMTVPAN